MNKEFLYYLNSIIGKEKDKLITQEKLAKSVECTTVSMSRYLSGQREIPVDILFKIKKALNISDEEFMIFYQEYSVKDNLSQMIKRIDMLSDESKNELFNYIDYLIYKQNQIKIIKKLLKQKN